MGFIGEKAPPDSEAARRWVTVGCRGPPGTPAVRHFHRALKTIAACRKSREETWAVSLLPLHSHLSPYSFPEFDYIALAPSSSR